MGLGAAAAPASAAGGAASGAAGAATSAASGAATTATGAADTASQIASMQAMAQQENQINNEMTLDQLIESGPKKHREIDAGLRPLVASFSHTSCRFLTKARWWASD